MSKKKKRSRPPLKFEPLSIEANAVLPQVDRLPSLLVTSLQGGIDDRVSRIVRSTDEGVMVLTSRRIDVFAEEEKAFREAGLIPPSPIKYSK